MGRGIWMSYSKKGGGKVVSLYVPWNEIKMKNPNFASIRHYSISFYMFLADIYTSLNFPFDVKIGIQEVSCFTLRYVNTLRWFEILLNKTVFYKIRGKAQTQSFSPPPTRMKSWVLDMLLTPTSTSNSENISARTTYSRIWYWQKWGKERPDCHSLHLTLIFTLDDKILTFGDSMYCNSSLKSVTLMEKRNPLIEIVGEIFCWTITMSESNSWRGMKQIQTLPGWQPKGRV